MLGIVVVVLAAGCGGGGKELSKEQYVSKLNAMCADFGAREKVIGEPQTLSDLAEKGPRILVAFEQAIADKVGDLKAPDEIAGQARRLVEIADQQRDTLGGLVDAAKREDFSRAQELSAKNAALNREANSLAGKLGAAACAEG